tara:strand:+ start:554 stop:718 length:165 start_codon:yes stop_codon:yes gene_type:complete
MIWKQKRINAMNKIIKVAMGKGYNVQHMNENYIQEYSRVINSKAKTKQEYKLQA